MRRSVAALHLPVLGTSLGDLLLAAAFVLASDIDVLVRTGGVSKLISTGAGSALAGLAWRRRWPLLPLLLLAATRIVGAAAGISTESNGAVVGLFVATYSLGVYASNRELAIGAALPILAMLGIVALGANSRPLGSTLPFFAIFVVAAPIIAGRVIRARGYLVGELKNRQAALIVEQEARAAEALAADRPELLRRLGDVVARGIETLLAQVSVAESDRGELGRASAIQIESTARGILVEMRRLLAVLSDRTMEHSSLPAAIGDARVQDETDATRDRSVEASRAAQSWIQLLTWRWPEALALTAFLGLELELQTGAHPLPLRAASALGGLAFAAPLAWSRRRPLLAATAAWTAATLVSSFVVPLGPLLTPILLFVVCPFLVSALTSRWQAAAGLVICAIGGFAISGSPAASIFVLGPWIAGRVLHERSRLHTALDQTNRQLAEARDARARWAVTAERARVARELHDVIGHTLAVIVLQAGAGRRLWDDNPEQASLALATVSRVAEEGLTELLKSLESVDAEEDQRLKVDVLTQPGGLIGRARRAGLQADVAVEGEECALEPRLERAAYRVLQEAVTNVIKHAPGSRATITLRYGDGELELEVINPILAPVPASLVGQGLTGMHQRAVECGGQMDFGEEDGQKFVVRARFAVEPLAVTK